LYQKSVNDKIVDFKDVKLRCASYGFVLKTKLISARTIVVKRWCQAFVLQ